MTTSNIERYSIIRKEHLSQEFYFQSLLEAASENGQLNDSELESIQIQCVKLLGDCTERYSKGKSSSIMVEAAQAIMASNFYTIGIYLKSFPDTTLALDQIKNGSISELYYCGRKMIDTKIKVARYLLHRVCKTKVQTPNHTYNATVENGIQSFFDLYNRDFEAHETAASIDYQLMNTITDLAGVEYIIEYLQRLYMENLFCLKFKAGVIHEVMSGFHWNYKDLLVNIFTQVLQNALGCSLLNKDISSLVIEKPDIEKLTDILKEESIESLNVLLMLTAKKTLMALSLSGEALENYINAGLPEIASRIHFAVKNNTLQIIFVPRSICKS